MNRNFIGTMLMCRAVVPGMAARGQGAVINFGSLSDTYRSVSPEVIYQLRQGRHSAVHPLPWRFGDAAQGVSVSA